MARGCENYRRIFDRERKEEGTVAIRWFMHLITTPFESVHLQREGFGSPRRAMPWPWPTHAMVEMLNVRNRVSKEMAKNVHNICAGAQKQVTSIYVVTA